VGALAECIHQGILLNFTYISYDLMNLNVSKSNLLSPLIWVCKQPFFVATFDFYSDLCK
jgi:hypothetical protein